MMGIENSLGSGQVVMAVWTNPAPGALWQSFNMVGIGDRIAAYRRRRGLSQVTLAGLVGRSESWLSQVERGHRGGVDSLTVIRDLATALDTTADALIGVDLPAPTARVSNTATDAVRRYVDGYSQLLIAPQTPTGTAAQLSEAAETLNATYQAARYDEVLAASPDLLAAVDALARSDTGPDAVHANGAAYVITAKILHKIGESRLAALAADRAAAMAGRPGATGVDRGLAAREVVGALLYTGQADALRPWPSTWPPALRPIQTPHSRPNQPPRFASPLGRSHRRQTHRTLRSTRTAGECRATRRTARP